MITIDVVHKKENSQQSISLQKDDLEKGISLGRLPSCGIVLNDPSVSRSHGLIKLDNDKAIYFDVGSTTGSLLNGNSLQAQSPVALAIGDKLILGPFELTIRDITSFANDDMEITQLAGALPNAYQPVALVSEDNWQNWQGKTSVTCTSIVEETHDVKTFTYTAQPNVLFKYQAGQFATLHLQIDGKSVSRSYTISSSPSRPHTITNTVKRVPSVAGHQPGLVSNWLHDNLKVGDTIEISGPFGDFTHFAHPSEQLCLISGGSGITPMLSMTRWICDTASKIDVVFLHIAKSERDLIVREELEYLSRRFPNLKLVFSLTREENSSCWSGYRGRLSSTMLEMAVPDLTKRRVFVCGPNQFMQSAKQLFIESGFPMDKYHEESFGAPKSSKPTDSSQSKKEKPNFGLKAVFGKLGSKKEEESTSAQSETASNPIAKPPESSTINFTRSGKRVSAEGQTILEAGESAGVDLPFGCRAGMCGACKQIMINGELEPDYEANILSDSDKEAGYILCCIAKAKGEVKIEA